MEIRTRLESALGGTYTIDRELGGGGMSHVFAATETALGRKVVIKVVPAELGAGVNVDRFNREILLAANLQHPHIVPVLAAGEMNGIPYYTMPFIDGLSLRARLEQGPLPLSEVVSILRDVARALAYAHAHGVVHRDIKPDNVLLSGGSATVTDFGIAKAISASRSNESSSTLTQLGTSVGTPAYMAPEQAAADPSTNHRADIYSFGCLAYELLTGQPPFAGLPPHKLMVAHMSERPRSVAELRPDTPPMLADLVMQCLEKDPDARPQSAADVARLLDAVTSSTSNEFVPAIGLGGPTTLRRVLILYAIVFGIAVLVAKAAAVAVGVPDWVMPSTIGIMTAGLIMILATAAVQRIARRALLRTPQNSGASAAPPSTMATLAIKASPYMSWKHTTRTIASGIVTFAVLVVVLMALRPFGLGPFASLMGQGTLKNRDKILVADFTSNGTDTTLGLVVAEAVRADLGQSPVVSVVTPQTEAATLQRMQLPATTRVDTAIARQIAQREDVKAIVAGDVHTIGNGFVVTMKLVSADSARELASLSASADGVKDLIPTIGRLTRRLRARMGESLKHVQSSGELAQVTTSSLPALRKYTEGLRAMNVTLEPDTAIARFKEAVAIDTGFASAYRALAIALGNRGRERETQISALEKAYALANNRLPEVERWLSIAAYWNSGPHPDVTKAAAAYESLLVIRPTHYAALNNLALIYAQKRDFARADSLLRRSIASNPASLTAYGNLLNYQAEEGKVAAMESTYAAQLKASGNNPRIAEGRAAILFSRGEYDSTDAVLDSLVNANPSMEDLGRMRQSVGQFTAMVRGKMNESLRLASANATKSAALGNPVALLNATFDSAMVEGWYRGNKQKALAIMEAGLKRTPLETLKPLDRPYVSLAQLYALAGRADLARPMLAQFEATTSTMSAVDAASSRHGMLSAIALAEHRYLDAAHEAEAADVGPCTTCEAPMIALGYDLAEKPDSAIAWYSKYVNSKSILNRFGNDGFFLAGSYKRLGELYEAKGDRVHAVRYYTKFVELWKDADPDLQPKVAEVKRKLARLSDTEAR